MKKYFLLAFMVINFTAFSQTRIVKDSLMFSLSVPQVENIFTGLGIPPSAVGVEYAVDVHRLIYTTMNYDSSATIASGLLLIPKGVDYCKLPIISYQHGTIVDKRQVPSRWVGQERYISLAIASNGLISIMPDYLGMGDGIGLHPYQNARTEAFSVVDMIRATKEVCDSVHVGYGSQLFLFGYSQGGHATMAAHRMIQEQLAGEMEVTASAPMSGAYDMSGIQTDLLLEEKPYSDPYYLPYLIFGNNPIYHFFTNPSDVLKAPYDVKLPPLMNGVTSSNKINQAMNDTVKRIFRDDVIDSFNTNPNYFFRQFLKDNDVYQWVPKAPTRMYFCTKDEKVPYQNTYKAFAYFKQNGALDVDTFNSGELLHTDCAQPSLLSAKLWIDGFRTRAWKFTPVSQPSSTSASTGVASFSISGGKAPFRYFWNNSDTTASISGLAPGDYTCTITDANGCVKVATVNVNTVSGIDNITTSGFSIYPNPAHDLIHISLQKFEKNQEVEVLDVQGRIVKTQKINDLQNEVDLQNLSSGIFFIKIENQYTKFIKQ